MDTSTRLKNASKRLAEEFDDLWQQQRQDFVAWRHHDQEILRWRVFGVYVFGQRVERNCHSAPIAAALAEACGATSCLYSVLLPGVHIEPHRDEVSLTLRMLLGLRVPSGGACALRVGKQVFAHAEGSLITFDASKVHEGWNVADQPRAVLLLDLDAKVLPVTDWESWWRFEYDRSLGL